MKRLLIMTAAMLSLLVIHAQAQTSSGTKSAKQPITKKAEISTSQTQTSETDHQATSSNVPKLNANELQASRLRAPFETTLTPRNVGITENYGDQYNFDLAVAAFCNKLGYKGALTFNANRLHQDEPTKVICYD